MMVNAKYFRYNLEFKRPSGTSRGILTHKETWFILLEEKGKYGIGECGILRGLSIDDRPDYEQKLKWVCENINIGSKELWKKLSEFPSIQFGVESAFLSLYGNTPFVIRPTEFTQEKKSIPINGLVWMGDEQFMKEQIQEKIANNFKCIKLKIGAIDFEKELHLLQFIRSNFNSKTIEIRVDANGSFTSTEALYKLNQLSELEIHSIEQPISSKQYDSMAELCRNTPIPIALDEELIGITNYEDKVGLLMKIKPQYIILKPSLIGGLRGSLSWIKIAEKLGIGWWVTSALESNIGLNIIAQFTSMLHNKMPQGLGTGSLYTNNFLSPLEVQDGELWYRKNKNWGIDIEELYNSL